MVHYMTNISAKSGYGLINAEALLGGDTTSVHINYITTNHDITNTGGIVCVEFVRPALNHGIFQNADACLNNVALSQNENE